MGVYSLATTKGKKSRAARLRNAAPEAPQATTTTTTAPTPTTAAQADHATAAAAAAEPPASRVEYSEPAQWVERMALTSTRSLPTDLDADDDPRREEAFIQQALLSVMRGIGLLEQAEVPWQRPDDYYAEMYKDDVHMNHVRRAMEAAKARIEAQAHRRAMKDQKSYGKEVQAEVLRQRARYKREMQDRLSEWRQKKRHSGGAAGDDDAIDDVLEDGRDAGAQGGGRRSGGRGAGRRHGGGGGGSGARPARARNLQPGGKSRRPGKNARHRRGA